MEFAPIIVAAERVSLTPWPRVRLADCFTSFGGRSPQPVLRCINCRTALWRVTARDPAESLAGDASAAADPAFLRASSGSSLVCSAITR